MLFTKRDLRRLVLPLIGEQLLAVTVGMADTVMVAYAGEAAMSGVALVDSIIMLMLQLFAALCTGGAVVVSQLLGKGDAKAAGRAAGQLVQLAAGLALAVTALALPLRGPLLRGIFGAVEPSVMTAAQTYFLLTALSLPFLGVYNAGAALLRCIGDTAASLSISAVMNLVNVAGNAWLIYGCGLGVAGAALASLAARGVAAGASGLLLYHRHTPFSVRGQVLRRPQMRTVLAILRIGVPSGLENGMFQVGKLMVQRLVASFGTVAIAANAAAGNIACLATIPGSAVSLALLSVVGRCMGAGQPDEAAADTKRLMGMAFVSMGVLNVLVFLGLGPIVSVYGLGPDTAALTAQVMAWHCLAAALLWTPSFCLPSALRGAGDVSYTMKVSVASMWVCRIGCSYLLAQGLGLGLLGVWLAIFVDWLARAALFGLRFWRGAWRTKRVL